MEMPINPLTSSTLEPSKLNVADRITAELRRMMVDGQIPPGAPLGEPALARQFGASRAPVREALVALEREGLVEFASTGRTCVRKLTEDDFDEIVDARSALESMAARRAVMKWTSEDSRFIEQNIAAQAGASTLAQLSRLDVEMHEYILRRSGNARLLALWLCIRPQFEMWLAHTHRLQARLTYKPRQVTVEAHRKLLRAIETRKPDKAAAAMSTHIEGWREWLPAAFPMKKPTAR